MGQRLYKIRSPGDLSADLDTAENNFASGLYASTIAYTNRLESVRSKMQYDWKDVAYLRPPTFDGRRPGPLATRFWTMAMNSKSKSKDEAWLFMSEYFSKQGDMDMVVPGGQLPMRTSNLGRPEMDTPEKAYVRVVRDGFADWGFIEPARRPRSV
jgi:ABC-type glycerol-3-phosphate transport system substrate-binding protein